MFRHKWHLPLLLVGIVGILAVIGVIIIGRKTNKALIRVESNEEAAVYIDNERIGITPVEYESEEHEVEIKIVPKNQSNTLLPYETQVSLTPHTKTIVRHKFYEQSSRDSTQILSFVEFATKSAPIAVVTNPAGAKVFIDNSYVGTSPLQVTHEEGAYSVVALKEGFSSVSFQIQNKRGYLLTAFLALPKESSNSTAKEPETLGIGTVLSTGYGYLSVKESPKDTAHEIARIFAGRDYLLEEFDVTKIWAKIRLNASESGWVKASYLRL